MERLSAIEVVAQSLLTVSAAHVDDEYGAIVRFVREQVDASSTGAKHVLLYSTCFLLAMAGSGDLSMPERPRIWFDIEWVDPEPPDEARND